MIELSHVTKRYGSKLVLSDLSASFERGRHYAVLGPSGCGKTTLLRLCAGLETPDSGRIVSPFRRIAFCFQEDRLLPRVDVRTNLMLALPDRLPAAQKRALADEWLGRVGLSGEGSALPGTLSGGMCRRAALARALCFDADVLLLDEPFRALDEAMHRRMLALVRTCAEGKTLLMVTHDPQDAEGMHRFSPPVPTPSIR